MFRLQLSNVIKVLEEEKSPQLDFQSSAVRMIVVEKDEVIQFFRTYKNKNEFLIAEVYGYSTYQYSSFDIRIKWQVPSARYEGIYGVRLGNESVQIIEVELLHKGKVARLFDNGKLVGEEQTVALLKKPFETSLQDWKLYPFLSANALQPTHYKVKNKLMDGIEVNTMVEIQHRTFPQLRKQVVENGGYELLNSFSESVSVENQLVCMEGFSTYRLGSKDDAILAHLHWLVRGPWETDGNFEIALVESDNFPGAFFTGIELVDSMEDGREVVSIMRLLGVDRNWRRETIALIKNWIIEKDKEQRLYLKTSDTLKAIKEAEQKNSAQIKKSSVRQKPSNDSAKQLDLFGDLTPKASPYEMQSVLDGNEQLCFSGLRVGRVIDKTEKEGVISIFDLYQTDNNQWVGVKQHVSAVNNSASDISKAKIFEDKKQIFDFFENDTIAKDLYQQAQSSDREQKNEK
jgi:hypothetical protein